MKASTYDTRVLKEPEDTTPIQSYSHWMKENALRMEMGIPLIPHPKHSISEIDYYDEFDSSSRSDEDSDEPNRPEQAVDHARTICAS